MYSEMLWRLLPFISLLLVLGCLEHLKPWRPSDSLQSMRWRNHISLQLLAMALIKLVVPVSLMGVAMWGQQHGWGLMLLSPLPTPIAWIATLVLMDLAIYSQHRVMHRVPALWRLHRLHHSDRVLDVTTALRFHPLEMLLSLFWKMAVVLVLGASAEVVLLFEILLSSAALFNHANIRLNPVLERCLRCFVVTPDMHRVHHARVASETDSNFGFCLSCWDRWFQTYSAKSAQGEAVDIGLNEFSAPRENRVLDMLTQPWR